METEETKKQVEAIELELQKDIIYLIYLHFLFIFIEVLNINKFVCSVNIPVKTIWSLIPKKHIPTLSKYP